MLIRRGLAALSAILLSANGALAGQTCFNTQTLEAWQAVRYMTELMVLNDTCHRHVYEIFVKRNYAALDAYHRELVAHFRLAGDRRPDDTVDRYVTRAANQVSETNDGMPTANLCQLKASYFANAEALSGEQFRHFVADLAKTRGSAFRRCNEQQAADSQ